MFGAEKVVGSKHIPVHYITINDQRVIDLKRLSEDLGRAKGEVLGSLELQHQIKVNFGLDLMFEAVPVAVLLMWEHPKFKEKIPIREHPDHYQLRQLIAKHPAKARELIGR